jgi:tetratricopeptide (TPR) repeat protein
MLAIILTLLKIREKPGNWYGFVFGLTGALAILTRPVMLPFFGAGCVWLIFIWFLEHLDAAKFIRGIISVSFGFLVVASPVLILSHRITGRARILPYSGGINFYIGNNPNYKKTITIRPGLRWRELIAIPSTRGIEDDHGMERFFQEKTIDFIVSEPLSFLKGLVYKTAQFFNSREMPRNMDIYLFRKWSRLLGLLVWKIGRFGFPYGVLLPLAFLGLGFYWRKIPVPVWHSLLFYPASVIVVFVSSRYRIPVVPVIVILAAAGLGAIWNTVQEKRWKKLAVACMIALVIGGVSSATGPFYEERLNYEAELYYGMGSTFDKWGKVDEAKSEYLKAIELRADYAEAHYNLANILQSQGRLQEAISHYNQSVQIKPNSIEIRNNFGAALQMQGRVDQAIKQWEKVLELDPEDPYAHFNIGLARAGQGKHNQSIKHFNKALQARPDWVDAHVNMGMILFQQGQIDEAIVHLTEALRLRPNDVEVHNNLGIALGSQGRLDQAVQHFRQAIKLEPRFSGAHYNLGYALELQGKLEEAIAEYRFVLQTNPNHAESRRRLDALLENQ